MKFKKIIAGIALLIAGLGGGLLVGCSSDADTASNNLSNAADNFEIMRRIVFINGITDQYLLVIEGYCSLGNDDPPDRLSVTCKVGTGNDAKFYKHFLGRSDNVTYVVEQLDGANVGTDPLRGELQAVDHPTRYPGEMR